MGHPHLMKLETDYFDLPSLFFTLLEKKWLLLGIGFLTSVLACSYVLIKPAKYQATVLLEVHHKAENSLGSVADQGEHSRSESVNEEPISLQVALIYSKFILEPVIRSLGLDHEILPAKNSSQIQISYLQVPEKFLKKRLILDINQPNHFRLRSPTQQILLEGSSNQLINHQGFSIKIDKIEATPRSQFFLVKKPESEIIQKIRSHLVVTDLSNSTEGSLKKAGLLQLMVKGDHPDKIIQLINQIAWFTQVKDKERKSLEAKKTLEFLYQQLPLVQASLKTAEAQLNEYRSTSGKIDLKLQTEYLLTHLSDIDKQLEAARLKEMDLFQLYTPQHPFVIALKQKIQTLTKQRQEMMSQIKKLPAADQMAANFYREVNVNNHLYTALLHKIHEQQVITAGIVSDIGILSLATFADQSFRPNWFIIFCSSFIIGMMVGSLGIVFWQIFSRPRDEGQKAITPVEKALLNT